MLDCYACGAVYPDAKTTLCRCCGRRLLTKRGQLLRASLYMILFGLLVLAFLSAGFRSMAHAAELPLPWHHPDADPSAPILVLSSPPSQQSWFVTLSCEPSRGFQVILVANNFRSMVSAVYAKAGGEDQPTSIQFDQDPIPQYRGAIKLINADRLERKMLTNETLSLKLVSDAGEHRADFRFPGLKATAAQVMKLCPPF